MRLAEEVAPRPRRDNDRQHGDYPFRPRDRRPLSEQDGRRRPRWILRVRGRPQQRLITRPHYLRQTRLAREAQDGGKGVPRAAQGDEEGEARTDQRRARHLYGTLGQGHRDAIRTLDNC